MHSLRMSVATFASLAILAGCGDAVTTSPPPDGNTIVLSQAQAALIVQRVTMAAPTHPELAALADTINVIVKAGAEANRMDVTTNSGVETFYAVGLHRAVKQTPESHSTFHVIGFDDPSNPTSFLVLGGWRVTGANPPTSVTGSFAGPGTDNSVTGHLFSVSGSAISVWHAVQGTSTLAAAPGSEACVGFTPSPGVTCAQSELTATFAMTSASPDPGSSATGTRSASSSSQTLPGITLAWDRP
jgi:hypothetical protein